MFPLVKSALEGLEQMDGTVRERHGWCLSKTCGAGDLAASVRHQPLQLLEEVVDEDEALWIRLRLRIVEPSGVVERDNHDSALPTSRDAQDPTLDICHLALVWREARFQVGVQISVQVGIAEPCCHRPSVVLVGGAALPR